MPYLQSTGIQMIQDGASKLEGEFAQHEVTEATLKKKLEEMCTENTELRQKNEDMAEQLKSITQMTIGLPENLSKMSFDEIKEAIKKIRQMSLSEYLPSSEEESAERHLPAATPKKPSVHIPVRPTATSLMRMHHGHPTQPQTSQQRNVTLRKPPNTTAKPASTPKKKSETVKQ